MTSIESMEWTQILALDVSFTVDSIGSGRWTREMAIEIARNDHSCVRDSSRNIIADYRNSK
jgi:hypothetical protein